MDEHEYEENLKGKDREIAMLEDKIGELRSHIEDINNEANKLYNLIDTKI